ncbi:MAG TPA: protein kinase, partial [Vicinamibacterales bacterium]|nr:protein kinase [Vicinamibacterales bacterium]
MTPERFRLIRNLYEAALELDVEPRQAFLRRACRGDDDLYADVERLLIAHERTDGLIAPFVVGPSSSLRKETEDAVPRLEGRRVGAYQLLRELGRGGMGAVYLASRADAAYDRLVAIKIVIATSGETANLQRFREERQILANLDHPNIAHLLDDGTTDDGL